MQKFCLDKYQIFDNVEYFKQNSEKDYVETIQKIIKSDPFFGHKFYIYSFVKRVDDISGVKKMYHQPRLTRPDPITGTTLLKADPKNPDEVRIIWTLPNEENFNLYSHGKIFADPFVFECVQQFLTDKESMKKADADDLNDDQIREVYKQIKYNKLAAKNVNIS